MKVTFRCKQSGNTVSFTNESDIEMMRKEEGYEEVIENGTSEKIEVSESIVGNPDGAKDDKKREERKDDAGNEKEAKVLKKAGRPKKS